MLTVDTTITVRIPGNGAALGEVEERMAQAVEDAGQGAAGPGPAGPWIPAAHH